MSLESLLVQAREYKGIRHNIAIRVLREYIEARTDEEVVSEISEISEPLLFPYLWEVGLRLPFQMAGMTRLSELTEGGK